MPRFDFALLLHGPYHDWLVTGLLVSLRLAAVVFVFALPLAIAIALLRLAPSRALRALGVDCSDPKPADSLFHAEARARYDAVICMYHDQALIPVKMLDFWGGVNITLGLPIVRTSPDHGVGFDIAGRGLARPDSLIAAIRMAGEIADRRQGAAAAA